MDWWGLPKTNQTEDGGEGPGKQRQPGDPGILVVEIISPRRALALAALVFCFS